MGRMSSLPEIPRDCALAFKEWESVCSALGDGRQTIILRKGGIDEGPAGFKPEHHVFWLYPTHVHEAQQGVQAGTAHVGPPSDGTVRVGLLAVVSWIGRIENEGDLQRLEGHHIWTPETVLKRFHYRAPGLWVLVARMFRRHDLMLIPITPEHAGCKTWVPLDPPLSTDGLRPVLDDETFQARLRSLQAALTDRSATRSAERA
jgi:hypothetical protein